MYAATNRPHASQRFLTHAAHAASRVEAALGALQRDCHDIAAAQAIAQALGPIETMEPEAHFPAMRQLAEQMAIESRGFDSVEHHPVERDVQRWHGMHRRLTQLIDEARGTSLRMPETTDEVDRSYPSMDAAKARAFDATPHTSTRQRTVLVVDTDKAVRARIQRAIAPLTEQVHAVSTTAEAFAWLQSRSRAPDLLITEMLLGDGLADDLIAAVRAANGGGDTAIIVATRLTGFEDQLGALRAGADTVLEKPLNPGVLARDAARYLSAPKRGQRRVLVVHAPSDDVLDAPSHDLSFVDRLNAAGFNVHICDEPWRFDDLLHDTRPDAVVIDYDLSGTVSATDLARYVRQHDAFGRLPILAYTAERTRRVMRTALKSGIDHIMSATRDKDDIAAAIDHAIDRIHSQEILIEHDALTDALNAHGLRRRGEALISQRTRNPETRSVLVAVELLDVPAVQLRRGRLCSDRLVSALASFINERVRATDVVAHLGDGRFVIIFPDIATRHAISAMEHLATDFGAIVHRQSDGATLQASLRFGVAPLSEAMTHFQAWLARADEALQTARDSASDIAVR